MSFNPTKCVVLRITRKRNPINATYKIHNHDLEVVKQGKNLGVTLAETCPGTSTWTRSQKKANNTLAFLWRNISRCPSEIKAQCYTSLVRPVIEYAATARDPYTARNIQQLEAVQRRAARFVTGDYKTTSSNNQMIANLSWSSLQQRRTEARLVMMYRITHDLVYIPVAQYLHPATVMHIRGPSQSYMLPFCRTDVTVTHSSPQESAFGINCQSMPPPPRPWTLSRLA